jgi:DNA-binding Xre family transcriptional regulator
MANLFIIRDLIAERKVTLRDLANTINISEDGLQKIIKNGRTKTETLEKIAKTLNVPVGIFFDEMPLNAINQNVRGDKNMTTASIYGNANISNSENELEATKKELEYLRGLLQEKERTIQILMKKYDI